MKWRCLVHGILVLSMSCMLFGSTVLAQNGSVEKHGHIGAVDISISHEFTDETINLMPGERVGIESYVTNTAEPAWIRARIDYPYFNAEHGQIEQMELPSDALVAFSDPNWKRIGSWYYYLKPVTVDTKVPFTESITFPSDWDNSYVDASFDMEFTAEAVQEKNFTPDFSSSDPWHGVVIQAYDADNYKFAQITSNHFSVSFENGSQGLVHTDEDFAVNLDNAMPGDTFEGDAEISNKMDVPVKLYFEADSGGDHATTDKIHLKIFNDDAVIFDDVLSFKLGKTLLAEYQPGDSSTFRYEISIPTDMDNNFARTDFLAIWKFSCDEIPSDPELPPVLKRIVERIDTGDAVLYGIVAVSVVLVVFLIVTLVRKVGGRRG